MSQQFFIGFTRFEEFLAALDDTRDINLAPITNISRDAHFNNLAAYVITSQVKDGHLIYCKMSVAKWCEMFIGIKMQPFGERDAERAAAAPKLQQQLMDIARDLIYSHFHDSVLITEGAPSFPNDLILIDGWPDSATYDRESGMLVLKQYAAVEHAD
jgi:hypothetical protein